MRNMTLWIALLSAIAPGAALAQDGPDGDVVIGDPGPPSGGDVEPEGDDEGPIDEPEIPGGDFEAITAEDLEGGTVTKKRTVRRYDKKSYPTELVLRPLTLVANQFELRLDAPFASNSSHPTMWQVLHAAFGVTRDVQVGLTYSFGLIRLKTEGDEKGFEAGRAFSFDGLFTIIPNHWAAGVSLPFYVDPDAFAFGVNLTLPFRVNFGSKWAIFGGHDLLQMRIVKMPVDPTDPGYNLAIVAAANVSVAEPVGNLSFRAGGMHQFNPNVAAWIELGIHYPDFEQLDQPVSLFAGASWSRSNRFDLGGRLGFFRLDEAGSFSLSVYAALRL